MQPIATPPLPRIAPTPELSRRAGASGASARCAPTSGSEDSGAERSGGFFGTRLQRPMAMALGSAAGGTGSAGAETLEEKSHSGTPPYSGAMAMPRGAVPARSLTTTPFRDGTPPVALTPEPPGGGIANGADAFAQLMPRAEVGAEVGAEVLPPLELGGDMYVWATQQLHLRFPTISDRGEIAPPRGQERRAHPFLAVAAALVDPAVAAAAAAVADATNGGASANGGGGAGGAGVSTPSTLISERPARTTKSYAMAFGGLRIGGDDRERQQAVSLKCEDQLATLDSGSPRCSSLALHASEPLLVAASAREELSVWNYKTKQRINAFANANPAGSRCTSLHLLETAASFVHGHASGLLLVGSSEGAVRIWRQWALPGEQQMVGSFSAADRSAAATEAANLHDSRLFTAYQPQGALLSVAGTSDVIRQWDLVAERCARQLTVDVANAFSVRALSSDQVSLVN